MYGPSHAPGMRQSNLTIWKYFVKKPKSEPGKLWVPNEEEDELDMDSLNSSGFSSDMQSSPAGAGVSVMAALGQAIPRLMDKDEGEEAAHDVARLTNRTCAAEDLAAAKAGALEGLAHILMTGSPAASASAASALANLVANADPNKTEVCRIPGAIARLLEMAGSSKLLPTTQQPAATSPSPSRSNGASHSPGGGGGESPCDSPAECRAGKGSDAAVRALLNIASSKESSALIFSHEGALESICCALSSAQRLARDDASRLINTAVSHDKATAILVGSSPAALEAILGVMEGEGEGEARLWCCSAIHCLSRSPQLKSKLLGCGVLQRGLLPILLKAADELGDWAEATHALVTLSAANLCGGDADSPLEMHRAHVKGIVHVMAMAMTSGEHGRFRFRCGHVLVALKTLVKNEALRPDLVHAKLLELTMDMIAVAEARSRGQGIVGDGGRGGNQWKGLEVESLLDMVLHLSFCDAAQAKMQDLNYSKLLDAHARSGSTSQRRLSRAAMWMMSVRESLPSREGPRKGVVVVSCRGDERLVASLVEGLQGEGYDVLMAGSSGGEKGGVARGGSEGTSKRMSNLGNIALASRGASVVLLCSSREVLASPLHRVEALAAADAAQGGGFVLVVRLDDAR